MINVNLPDRLSRDICGIQWCRQNSRGSMDGLKKQIDPRGQAYFWYTFPKQPAASSCDITEPIEDTIMLNNGYITLTPIRCNLTDESELKRMGQSPLTSFWTNYQTKGTR